MAIDLECMAIEMPQVAGHPNRIGFRGVLTFVDEPSDKPPSGSRGHRVLLTRAAAEAALPSLLGMGMDYAPSLDRHDARLKVGVITRAEIVGKQIEIGGFLYGKDFPELVQELGNAVRRMTIGQALGMSYEISGATILDPKAKIWTLTKVTFTGAAILRKEKAAYRKTWIELEKAAPNASLSQMERPVVQVEAEVQKPNTTKENNMNEETMQSFATTAERLAGAAEALERVLGKIEAQQEEIGLKVDRIVAAVEENFEAQGEEGSGSKETEARLAELERANVELKAQATRLARKTFSPLVTALLGKYEGDGSDLNAGVLDKTLSALSVEQRIAVKAEMARAGILK